MAVAAGVLVGAYLKLARRFMDGFHRTVYALREKYKLTVFWPFLYVADARGFRENFRAATARGAGAEAAAGEPRLPSPAAKRDGGEGNETVGEECDEYR